MMTEDNEMEGEVLSNRILDNFGEIQRSMVDLINNMYESETKVLAVRDKIVDNLATNLQEVAAALMPKEDRPGGIAEMHRSYRLQAVFGLLHRVLAVHSPDETDIMGIAQGISMAREQTRIAEFFSSGAGGGEEGGSLPGENLEGTRESEEAAEDAPKAKPREKKDTRKLN